jgi:HEPN domain-containing protein
MDSKRDAEFRLKLSQGFSKEAEEDYKLSRWRSCVDNAQLAVENAAKAAIALFAPIPKSHNVTQELKALLRQNMVTQSVEQLWERLIQLSEDLGYEEHIKSDYGEEDNFLTPWDLFGQKEAEKALKVAKEAVSTLEKMIMKLIS